MNDGAGALKEAALVTLGAARPNPPVLLAVVTAGGPKEAVAVDEPPPPPKLNRPVVEDVVVGVGTVDVCDKEDEFDPKPKTFEVAEVVGAAVVF